MKTVPLTQGFVALVDDSDFERVSAFKWFAMKNGRRIYAGRSVRNENGVKSTQALHQFLIAGEVRADHVDGDGLNNQRDNLRPASRRQNQHGFQRKQAGATSSFRGVCWAKSHRKWKTQIKVNDKTTFLGYFENETDAARAYDISARQHFGVFASPNFP